LDLSEKIQEFIDEEISKYLQEDGGDLFFHGFNEITGEINLAFQGACLGCSHSSAGTKFSIELRLREAFPEIKTFKFAGPVIA